jgi:hypothetical protein
MSPTLSRIANAIGAVVLDQGVRTTGDQVGAGKSSISRWGDDLNLWPIAAVLALAAHHESLRQALIDALRDQAQPMPSDLVGLLADDASLTASINADTIAALGDGRIDVREAQRIRADLVKRMEHDAVLLRSLDAAQGVRP